MKLALLLLAPLLSTGDLVVAQPTTATGVPEVVLSEQHKAMCKVGVGAPLPPVALTKPDGAAQTLKPLLGKRATVVALMRGDGWMTRMLRRDLTADVADAFGGKGVATLAIDVGRTPAPNKTYTVLADPDGKAFALFGTDALPRVYVADAAGKIVWFDLEYSRSTRRELRQTLVALAGEPGEG